jgi:6-phosphogluconate dehydrogenase
VPNIDTAVAMRDLSCFKNLRVEESRILKGPAISPQGDKDTMIFELNRALYASMILTYSQGFAVLRAACEAHSFPFALDTVASIWRGGCIIRSTMLDEIKAAYEKEPRLEHLLDNMKLAEEVINNQSFLRNTVRAAAQWGLPAPGMMAALSYFDALRSSWLPTNLIQAQRDYFGSHTYERIDEKGVFHTKWTETEVKTI